MAFVVMGPPLFPSLLLSLSLPSVSLSERPSHGKLNEYQTSSEYLTYTPQPGPFPLSLSPSLLLTLYRLRRDRLLYLPPADGFPL
jgi:hypothetical protein